MDENTSLSRKSYARALYHKLAQHPSFQFLHVPLRNLLPYGHFEEPQRNQECWSAKGMKEIEMRAMKTPTSQLRK